MLRWTMAFATATFLVGSAGAADLPRGAAVYGKAPPIGGSAFEVESDLLFTPSDGTIPVVRIPPHTPILPGSSALPGYYGSNHSYEYQGPYYGGPYLGHWYRLPYTCGVYGYC